MDLNLGIDTKVTLFAAGLIFLFALILGVWKYRLTATSQDHQAPAYVDVAHRAALLYSFATLLVAVFVEMSGWPTWVNMTAAMVMVYFFVTAIGTYLLRGVLCDTNDQFDKAEWRVNAAMVMLIVGEIGGFMLLLAGFGVGGF